MPDTDLTAAAARSAHLGAGDALAGAVEVDIEPEPVDQSSLAQDLPADRFSNRELSWLAFNARVLAQAENAEPK